MTFGGFASFLDNILGVRGVLLEADFFTFSLGVFDHHNGVSARWDGGASHYLEAGQWGKRFSECVAGFDFAGAF